MSGASATARVAGWCTCLPRVVGRSLDLDDVAAPGSLGASELTTSELTRRDAYVECSRTGCPRLQQSECRQLARLVTVERLSSTVRDHAPALLVLAVELVDFESKLGVLGMAGGQRSICGGAEHDGAIVDGEVDGVDLWAAIGTENDSADGV